MALGGRPTIEIDWEQVDSMLKAQCDGREIAAALGIHEDTLYNRTKEKFGIKFSAYSAQKHSHGKGLLRFSQYQKARDNKSKGNTQMLIWLGKQYLKQKDTEQDLQIDESTLKQFEAIMNQIKSNQENTTEITHESVSQSGVDLNNAENINNTESKS